MNAIGIQMDSTDPAVERRIVILAAGGYADDLCLDVLRDDAHLLQRQIAVREAGQGRSGGDHQRRRSRDSRTRRRFGIGFN